MAPCKCHGQLSVVIVAFVLQVILADSFTDTLPLFCNAIVMQSDPKVGLRGNLKVCSDQAQGLVERKPKLVGLNVR